MSRYAFQGTFRDGQGNIVSSGQVIVYPAGTTTAATIYADDTTVDVSPYVESDSNGYFIFYVDDGDYDATQLFDIQLSKTGYASKTYPDIAVIAVSLSMVKADSDVADAISKKHSVGDSIASSISDGDTTHSPDGNSVFDALALKLDASSVLDDDTMAANSAVLPVSQQSALAYFMAKTGANLTIGGDADGDMYYRASSVLARLAKGTANHKMFMNAGATAPEWASGIKMGTFTRALNAGNGDVAITGVGFKPSALIVFWAGPAAYTSGMGFADASVEYCMFSYPTDNYHSWSGTSLMQIYSAAGKIDVAVLKTFDTDGFTLTWAQSGSPTGTANIAYLALR